MTRARLVATVCLIAGVVVIAYGLLGVRSGLASRGWASTEGRVLASDVIRSTGGTGTNRSSGYKPSVRYTYVIDGVAHEADRLSFRHQIARTESHARAEVDRYPVGATVTVHYDPDDPSSATLETGVGLESFAIPGFGAALLLAGVIFVRRGPRRKG